ncbi:MAG: J domain-containing protein, partial [Polyangiaceae bacterium]|nr:J domain-containing protein [Polyangiaceae bacterium]
ARARRRSPPGARPAPGPRPEPGARPAPGPRPEPRVAPPRLDEPRLRALTLLGLQENATEADVRRAFRRLASRLHPDRFATHGAGDHSNARFAELSAAYHLLVA